ncbi:hypothetical protein FACS1894190_05850 [Spirochaetia bacterium]|nr:hypothetical protein FACS1894190_05850 [Spirochaetia bacterium]
MGGRIPCLQMKITAARQICSNSPCVSFQLHLWLSMHHEADTIHWHPAFVEAIKLELAEYKDVLNIKGGI